MTAQITGKFAIERAAPGNSNSFWPPTQTAFRGRWDHVQTTMGSSAPEYIQLVREFPHIMGQCVEIDMDRMRMRIYDPYAQPENKERAEKLIRLNNSLSIERKAINAVDGFEPDLVVEKPTHDQIKEWLYCGRNWLDKNKAVELRGRGLSPWPTMDAIIAMPGKIRDGFFNEMERTKYIYEVPVPAGV